VAMLKKKFLAASCHLLADNPDHWGYSWKFCFLCKGGLYRSYGYQAKCLVNGSKLECRMNRNCVARLKISTPRYCWCWISDISFLCWISAITSVANGKVYQLLYLRRFMSESNFANVCKCLMARTISLRRHL
jgi:hypothetical protein